MSKYLLVFGLSALACVAIAYLISSRPHSSHSSLNETALKKDIGQWENEGGSVPGLATSSAAASG
ncbi:MAG: hypothetical protein L0387_15890 [Acidobacteria bacterium]|nr:hypothetical protein [Acidobacteriota bacterium]MCI0623113.1 hypothetical protein [Acidobacteriota bacterium]MCI0720836.1 hypothetical protein [Acidobacteriota bacterium]